MKVTLMIEASAATLAKILATLPDDGEGINVSISGTSATGAPAPTPVPPPPLPVPPVPASDAGNGSDGDDGQPNADAPATDKNGLPWDERIHAKTKALNSDGSWRYRRGVDDATKTAVEAELKARAGAAMPAPVPPAPVPPVAPADNAAPPAPLPVPPVPPADNAAPPAPLPVPPVPAGDPAPAPVPVPAPVPPVPVADPSAGAAVASPAAPSIPSVQSAVDAVTAGGAAVAPSDFKPANFGEFMNHLASFMSKKDGNGAPLVHADLLSEVAKQVGDAYNDPIASITDIASKPPHFLEYAVQIFKHKGLW